MKPTTELSGFLASKVAKAKQQAALATKPKPTVLASPPSTQTLPATVQRPSLPTAPLFNPQPAKPAAKPQTSGKGSKRAGEQKPDRPKAVWQTGLTQALPEAVIADLDAEQVLALFRQHSTNATALELLRPRLVDLFGTIVSGALIRGAGGFADRMTLFRMLGLPWTPTAGMRGDVGNGLDALADRLVRAVSRVEARLGGRVPVMQDAELVIEARAEAAEVA